MTHRNLFRSIALTTGAALIGLAGANAQAHVAAGNYQTHVLPSTTRHTASIHHAQTNKHYARVAEQNSQVEAGNYQDHVVPHATRRNADQLRAGDNAVHHEVAMSDSAERR
ncbi:hypothetical protein [Salinisphaera hydrothermalis]|uniref:hypothetical protein n=1 Tax=Salinisphaera hydrothermalis TaxID=563188 RepID=UPI00333FC797